MTNAAPGADDRAVPLERLIADPARAFSARERLLRLLLIEVVMIVILVAGLVVMVPLAQPQLVYHALDPDAPPPAGALAAPMMSPLPLPNLTKPALLSWATTTVTEVMTYNFANYNERISSFRQRFTADGWVSFVEALMVDDGLERFRQSQLVLTTAPNEASVIVSEGEVEGVYEWVVQVPVVMTYVTNNNRSERRKSVIQLTIVRVPTLVSPSGIGIKQWQAM